MTQPFKLYRLQQLDSHLDRAHARLDEIKVALSDDQTLRQAEHQEKQAEEALQAARKSLQRAEEAVLQQRIKIEETEAALYGGKVRNPKELQDLQNEAAALKRYRNVLEDRQLEAMQVEEEAEATSRSASAQAEIERARLAERRATLIEEQSRLLKEIPNFDDERSATANSIPAEELNLYDNLRRQRRGLAVALVKDRTCSACGTTLNAALLHVTRSAIQITRCDSCGRILYAG